MAKINDYAPEFSTKAFHEGEIKSLSLSDFKGKWVILFFYPGDFTFVCPTELGELADNYAELQNLGVEVLSISTDSEWVHKAWFDSSDTIKKIRFPMLADTTNKICKSYGTFIADEGVSLRATFLIDTEGVVKAFEFHNNDIGRNVKELIRKIKAAKFVSENSGQVCPASWDEGSSTLKPGLDLVGKI